MRVGLESRALRRDAQVAADEAVLFTVPGPTGGRHQEGQLRSSGDAGHVMGKGSLHLEYVVIRQSVETMGGGEHGPDFQTEAMEPPLASPTIRMGKARNGGRSTPGVRRKPGAPVGRGHPG